MSRKKSAPVVFQGLQAGLKMFRWVILVLLVLFFFSGIQKVSQSSVGLLLRFGRLQGTSAGEQIKKPGAVFALPYPIDQLIEVPVQQEGEVEIDEVWRPVTDEPSLDKIDPVVEGYCLTGDQNIVQIKAVAKYRISDAVQFRLGVVDPEKMLPDIVLAALTQTVAQWEVDNVLRSQQEGEAGTVDRQQLPAAVMRAAQQRLDQLNAGMRLTAIELKEIHPPRHVYTDFNAVQDAQSEMAAALNEAKGFVAGKLPAAEAESNRLVQAALARQNTLIAQASAEASVFEQLHGEYRKNPDLVRRRLYLETLEGLAGVGTLRFLNPGSRLILAAPENAAAQSSSPATSPQATEN